MNSEQEKQWREDFEKWILTQTPNTDISRHHRTGFDFESYRVLNVEWYWQCYLAARKKAQEENEILEVKTEWQRETIQKLKEEIDSLRKVMSVKNHSLKHFMDSCKDHLISIQKRDKLLEQAKPWVKDLNYNDYSCSKDKTQWLKDVGELK